MKKLLSIIICCIQFVNYSSAQSNLHFQLVQKINGDIISFSVDPFENIYTLSSTNQLKKIHSNGDSVAVFNSSTKFGKISQIDVSNPLHCLIFYKDFSTILILDRFLSIRHIIDLRKQNIFQVQTLGLSYDNNIWLYDAIENKLKKINEEGKVMLETSDFRQLFGENFMFSSITDLNGLVYLYDKKNGVIVFDHYGTLKNRIRINDLNNFNIVEGGFWGTKGDKLFRYQARGLNFHEQSFLQNWLFATAFHFTSSKVFVLKNNELEIYTVQ